MTKEYYQLLKFFEVKTDDELEKKLAEEAKTLPCSICKKEFPIEQMRYIDGDPYCKEHYYGNV